MKSINREEKVIIKGIIVSDRFMHKIYPYLEDGNFKTFTANIICLACKEFYELHRKEGAIQEDIFSIFLNIKDEIRAIHRKEIKNFIKRTIKHKKFKVEKNLYSSILYLLSNKYLNLKNKLKKYNDLDDVDKIEQIVYVEGQKIIGEIYKYSEKLKKFKT